MRWMTCDAATGPGRYCSAVIVCHLTQKIWFKMRVECLADIALHVPGCRLTQETRVEMPVEDVAGNICRALLGRLRRGIAGGRREMPALSTDQRDRGSASTRPRSSRSLAADRAAATVPLAGSGVHGCRAVRE